MFLKSDRELFRRRPAFPWLRVLILLLVLGGGGYFIYTSLAGTLGHYIAPYVPGGSTPTPMPTPTPGTGILVAEGEDAYWRGSIGEAIAAYEQALDLEPHQVPLYLELARLLTLSGRAERGLEMARQALLRQPENAMAWALLGMAYDWLGLTDQAVAFCQKAVELDPTLPEAYAYLAEAYIDDGQWFAANEAIATAVRLDPNNVEVLRNKAYVLENQGNYYGAMAGYRDALEINDRLAHLYLAIGRNAGALGDLLRAREAYESAVEIDPQDALALDRLGLTQLLLGDYDSAKVNLGAALDQDPNLADAYAHLGTVFFHQRNYEDAIEMFRPAIQLGEARSRRRTVLFVITAEDIGDIGSEPGVAEVTTAAFIHPADPTTPMRGNFEATDAAPEVQGQIRFDVLEGRYELAITGVPPVPSGKVYVGWFLRLTSPEGALIRTEPLFPSPGGQVQMSGATGAVKGPSIETYYSYALSHYLLDECDQAIPLIEVALRIDPNDENAQRTMELCR